jgi:3-deoxy-D-manno-octulosonic-acid transferase
MLIKMSYLNSFLSALVAAAYRVFAPLAFRLYLLRHPRKYGDRKSEKFGHAPLRDASRPCLLVHAVSVGEALAAQSIVEEFSARHSDWDVFVSVGTATAREVAAKKFGAHRVAYYPLDGDAWVERFFSRLRPRAVVLMELEIWPLFLYHAELCRVPVVVANARITAKSAAQYARLARYEFLRRWLVWAFNAPAAWLAQTAEYAERLKSAGVEAAKIRVNGNVKFDQIPTLLQPEIAAQYRRLLKVETRLLVAGSTHRGEDETLLAVWQQLRGEIPALKLLIAPRHPERVGEVVARAGAYGKVLRRSQIDESADEAEIIVVDTLGELAKFYAAADAVFVGGTLIPRGGQNMAEPCGLAKPTVIGDSYFNFAETVAALRDADAITIVPVAAENLTGEVLVERLTGALREALSSARGARARAALLALQGASRRVVEVVEEVIVKR